MIRKDYIEKQLEQLGLSIAKIIADILKARSIGKMDSAISMSDDFINTEFNCTLEEIISTDLTKTIDHLTLTKQLSTGKINLLADLLFETTEVYEKSGKQTEANNLYKKLLSIYNYLNEKDKTFSLKRQEKITIIKSKL